MFAGVWPTSTFRILGSKAMDGVEFIGGAVAQGVKTVKLER
jgi:hypothetical protein